MRPRRTARSRWTAPNCMSRRNEPTHVNLFLIDQATDNVHGLVGFGPTVVPRQERRRSVLTTIRHELQRLVRDEEGASLVEYVLMVALIAVVCIAAVTLLGKTAAS